MNEMNEIENIKNNEDTSNSPKVENNEMNLDIALAKVDTIGMNTVDMLAENGKARKLFIDDSKENKEDVMAYIFGDKAENPLAHITNPQTTREEGYTKKIDHLVTRVHAQRAADSKVINK